MISIKTAYTFDDVLIVPKFSSINSRSWVDLSTTIGRYTKLSLPVISANMDTITGHNMCIAMHQAGGIGCLHRFMSIEENCIIAESLLKQNIHFWASIGIDKNSKDRHDELKKLGVNTFVIDVAHAAQQQVVDFLIDTASENPEIDYIVGNFIDIMEFNRALASDYYINNSFNHPNLYYPNNIMAYKIGIGPGSVCETRTVTGCGYPQLSAIMNNEPDSHPLIADGGCKTSGDIAKALAAGARAVMIGGMLAGSSACERPYEFRGSASLSSYKDQHKEASHRAPEGSSHTISSIVETQSILQQINGGLRSAFSYCGAQNLEEFQQNAEFVLVTANGVKENGTHFRK
jgi:IMP dehydrogenase